MISSRYAGHRFVLCTATDIVRWVRDQRHSPLINLMVEDSDQSYAHGSSWFQQTQEWYKHFTGLPGGLRMNIETACVLCNTLRPKQNAISEEYGSQHHNRHSWARLDIFVSQGSRKSLHYWQCTASIPGNSLQSHDCGMGFARLTCRRLCSAKCGSLATAKIRDGGKKAVGGVICVVQSSALICFPANR